MTEKEVTKLKGNGEKRVRDGEGCSEMIYIQCSHMLNYQKYFKIQ